MATEQYNNPPVGSPSFLQMGHPHSPLELVRKNSKRALASSQSGGPSGPMSFQSRTYSPPPHGKHNPHPIMVPLQPKFPEQPSPQSPLLHSSFNNRDSMATASVLNDTASYLDFAGGDSIDWRNGEGKQPPTADWSKNVAKYRSEPFTADDAGIYSTGNAFVPEPALRDSWNTTSTPRSPYYPGSQSTPRSPSQLPTFVVTDPGAERDNVDPTSIPHDSSYSSSMSSLSLKQQQSTGRAPIIRSLSNSSHYSMPMRAAPLASEEDEQKRKNAILARHAGGPRTVSPLPRGSSLPDDGQGEYTRHNRQEDRAHQQFGGQYSPQHSPDLSSPYSSSSPSLPHTPRHDVSLHPTSLSRTTSAHSSPEQVVLSRKPPSIRAGSPMSLYDRYSYYDLGSPGFKDGDHSSPTTPTRMTSRMTPLSHKGSRDHLSPSSLGHATPEPVADGEPNLTQPTTAWDFLHLGINAHLESKPSASSSPSRKAGRKHNPPADNEERLRQSAIYFEKSATIAGGCLMGMLMWGLALRHGWGVPQREKEGFSWLRKAAEGALDSANGGLESLNEKSAMINEKALNPDIQSELVVAIYEVGQCFFQGWGVPKDKVMAVSYYRTAARLGDADAQSDLGFCLANGKGCKKDRKEAAKWYRAAVAQGQSDVGLAWIHKDKFQD